MSKPVEYPLEIQKDLYLRLLEAIARHKQWTSTPFNVSWSAHAHRYLCNAYCFLELLENITVFSVGGGDHAIFHRGITFEERVQSFNHLGDS